MTSPLTGRPRGRRKQLNDDQVRMRMLAAAGKMIEDTGLTVSLEHLRYEEVIRHAGVSRSAAYRLWPVKEDFFVDFLDDLAGPAGPGATEFYEGALDLADKILNEQAARLATAEGRRQALREVVRQAVWHNFSAAAQSRGWRTYMALMAAIMSAPEGPAKDRLRATLAEAEQRFLTAISTFYSILAEKLLMKPRPPFDLLNNGGASPYWPVALATLGSAIIQGMVLHHLLNPEESERRFRVEGPDGPEEWSLVALAFLAAADLITEADQDP